MLCLIVCKIVGWILLHSRKKFLFAEDRYKSVTWTLSASINLSWWCSISLISVIPGLSAVSNTTAENNPNSVSFNVNALNVLVKCNTDEIKSAWKFKNYYTIYAYKMPIYTYHNY